MIMTMIMTILIQSLIIYKLKTSFLKMGSGQSFPEAKEMQLKKMKLDRKRQMR